MPLEHRLTVKVGAAPLADRLVLRARVHVHLIVLQRLDPIRVRVERRAAAQPLRHVLHPACIGGRRKQRLGRIAPHLIPAHVDALERRRALAQRIRQLQRISIAPAVAQDLERAKRARGAHQRITERLDSH